MKRLKIIPYIILMLLPVAGFVKSYFRWNDSISIAEILSLHSIKLLVASAELGLVSAIICVMVGLLAVLAISSTNLYKKPTRWFFLILAPVPYYIYSLTWIYVVRMFAYRWPLLTRTLSSGIGPCVFVNVMSFLPITTGLLLAEMEHLDVRHEQMGLVYGNWHKTIWKVIAPELFPMMIVSGIIVFILSVTDYSVPSLFQYNTFTLRIFSEYSRGLNLGYVALESLPLVIPIFVLSGIALNLIRKTSVDKNIKYSMKICLEKKTEKILCYVALVLCVMQIIVPFITFTITMGNISEIQTSINRCLDKIWISVVIAAMAGVISLIAVVPMASYVLGKKKTAVLFFALLPLAVPSALIGMGLLSAVNGSLFHNLSTSFLFPSLGCAIKYMPFMLLIFCAYGKKINKSKLEMAKCFMPSRSAYIWRVFIPMYFPVILGGFLVVSLLSFGEESIGLILMPPGYETLTVMIYNYLHYGASELVSAFCLLTIVIMAVLLLLMFYMIEKRQGKKYDSD